MKKKNFNGNKKFYSVVFRIVIAITKKTLVSINYKFVYFILLFYFFIPFYSPPPTVNLYDAHNSI